MDAIKGTRAGVSGAPVDSVPFAGEGSAARLRLFPFALVLLLAWGALAFGSEYSWAYAPLLVFGTFVGLLGLWRSSSSLAPFRPLLLALASVFVAALLQLVPLSPGLLDTVSPAKGETDYERLYTEVMPRLAADDTTAPSSDHQPISIAPSRTVLGLAFVAGLGVLFAGCVRGFCSVGSLGTARGIVALGLIVALVGIINRATGDGRVYGFWDPIFPRQSFAPFVNRNHFAGWMVMALSLSVGYFGRGIARAMRGVKPGWRNRMLWLSSQDASTTFFSGFAVAVMALSIILTVSRSGFLCLTAALAVSSWWALCRQSSTSRRAITSACLVACLVMAAAWGGVDAVLARFEDRSFDDVGGRVEIWQDTLDIVGDFPLTGTGLNTYGVAMLRYQTRSLEPRYVEAHNDYLQIAGEGGLLLGVPVLVVLVLFVRQIWLRFREAADDPTTYWLRAGAVTGLSAIAFQSVFDFTLQMPGAAALFVVLAAIAVHTAALGRHGGQRSVNADSKC